MKLKVAKRKRRGFLRKRPASRALSSISLIVLDHAKHQITQNPKILRNPALLIRRTLNPINILDYICHSDSELVSGPLTGCQRSADSSRSKIEKVAFGGHFSNEVRPIK
jgi:hypothetical protein